MQGPAASNDATASPAATMPAGAAPSAPATGEVENVPLLVGDTRIELPVCLGGSGPVFFCLGVRKSGSTVLHRIMTFLANRNNVNVVDVPSTFFRNGFTVHHWQALDLVPLIRPGNCYIGFRTYPETVAASEQFRTARKVFMFRDPRDALVSEYYSDAFSHTVPRADAAGDGHDLFLKKRAEAQATGIDDWVLDKVGGIRNTLATYAPVLDDPTCLVLRYEEFIFQKRRMIAKILDHFGWSVEVLRLARLLEEIDVVPAAEDHARFVRRVIPGDHAVKLKPETVRRLNHRLEDVMRRYDYY